MEFTQQEESFEENVQAKPSTEDVELDQAQLEAVAGGGVIGAVIGGTIGAIGGPAGVVGGAIVGHYIEEALK